MTAPDPGVPRLISFLRETVRDPSRPDRAPLAALRRGAGREPGAVPEMYPLVEPCIRSGASRREVDASYIVASLFAQHPVDWPQPEVPDAAPVNRSLGASFRWIRFRDDGDEDAGIERRFLALLDARREDLPRHLHGLVTLLRARNDTIRIDYARLLRDLARWDDPDHWVQRQWAEGFWRGAPSAQPTPDDADATASDEDAS